MDFFSLWLNPQEIIQFKRDMFCIQVHALKDLSQHIETFHLSLI